MANLVIGVPFVQRWTSAYGTLPSTDDSFGNFLRVELLSQNETGNTSTLRMTYLLGCSKHANDSGYVWYGYSKSTCPGFTIEWRPVGGTIQNTKTDTSHTYYKKTTNNTDVDKAREMVTIETVTVPHKTDGTCSIQVHYVCARRGGNTSYIPQNSDNWTETLVLPPINSATKISASPAVLESGNETITARAFNDTNKTTVSYSLDNSTWTDLVVQQTATGGVLTVPPIAYNTLKPLIGTKTTATVYVRAQTWLADGTTRVGLDQLAQFTVQTGVIPQSWYDDLNGGVGVTFGKKAIGEGFVIADSINPWDCEVNGKPWVNFVTEEHRETAEVEVAGGTTRRPMDSNCWRVWYDGTIEMWGAVEVNGGSSQTITFPYTLDACPTVQVSLTGSGATEAYPFVWNVTTTSMDLYLRRSGSFDTIMYYARGKVA